jgi:hypothetical protein
MVGGDFVGYFPTCFTAFIFSTCASYSLLQRAVRYSISPAEIERFDFERMRFPKCGQVLMQRKHGKRSSDQAADPMMR